MNEAKFRQRQRDKDVPEDEIDEAVDAWVEDYIQARRDEEPETFKRD